MATGKDLETPSQVMRNGWSGRGREESQEGAGFADDHKGWPEGEKEEGRASGQARLDRQGLVPLRLALNKSWDFLL